MKKSPPQEIFRAYDIRGIVDEQITPEFFYLLGKAYGSFIHPLDKVVVGYDGRLSSQELTQSLINGLVSTGRRIINIGRVPTPCLYHAVIDLDMDAGMMVTASHNPVQYNGCKMMLKGSPLAFEQIQELRDIIIKERFIQGNGSAMDMNFLSTYIDKLGRNIKLRKKYKVVVDCGNGVAGPCIVPLLKQLGCELDELYCDVDGAFPNHHPDPSKQHSLLELRNRIKEKKADIGYAFDGDGDRLGVLDHEGNIILPDRLLILFAEDLLSRHPGLQTPILYDVKCSSLIPEIISRLGGKSLMWKTGHSLMKRKMKEEGSLLGGEMSGHIFFGEDWFYSDDSFVAATRMLQILDRLNLSAQDAFARYPNMFNTPEITIPTENEQEKFAVIEALLKEKESFQAKKIFDIDGLRVEYEHGWGLIRASNTSPMLVLRFEAVDEVHLANIKAVFKQRLNSVAPSLRN